MNHASGQTLRIATAIAREFWERNRLSILLAPLGAILLPGFIIVSLRSTHGLSSIRGLDGAEGLNFILYWITILNFGITILPALENPNLRYTLPASNLMLFAAPMVCAMLTIFVQYSITAVTLNALFDIGWPIWVPGLLAAGLIAWCQALQWSTWSSVGLRCLALAASGLSLVCAIAWWAKRLGPTMAVFPQQVNGWHVFSFCVATVVCVGVGAGGFSLQRHGSGIDLRRMIDTFSLWKRFVKTARAIPFASAQSAQLWLEWRERGFFLPIASGLLGMVVVFLILFAKRHQRLDAVVAMSFIVSALPLTVIGLFWGSRSKSSDFPDFFASRPLMDHQIANSILKSATLAMIASALICIALTALNVQLASDHLEAWKLYDGIRERGVFSSAVFPAALIALAIWSAVCLVTSVTLAGEKVLGITCALVFGVVMVGFSLLRFFQNHQLGELVAQIYYSGCLLLCLIACAATFVASWRLRLISPQILGLAAALVVASGMMTIAVAVCDVVPINAKHLLVAFACCGMIPFPLAAAPLAVYWNRHR